MCHYRDILTKQFYCTDWEKSNQASARKKLVIFRTACTNFAIKILEAKRAEQNSGKIGDILEKYSYI